MPRRPCIECGTITEGTRCKRCRSERNQERDRHRGSTDERGYGADHRAEKTRLHPIVKAGGVLCSRCRQPIEGVVDEGDWHLDHNEDRTGYRGPAHIACNLGAPRKNPA